MGKGVLFAAAILLAGLLAVLAWRAGGDQPVTEIVQPIAVPDLPR